MLIEVCGVDGSGKSTLIDGARRRIRAGGPHQAYERTLRSESRNLLEMVCLEEGAQVFGPRDQELAVLLDAVAQAASLVQYRDTAVSHAFVTGYQCALAARLEERGFASDVGLMKLVDRLPSPDLLVFLRIPTEVALSRIHQRTKGDGLLATADPLAAVTLRQCALQLSSERFGAVELDATAPAAVLVDHVVGLIEQQPSEGRPPG